LQSRINPTREEDKKIMRLNNITDWMQMDLGRPLLAADNRAEWRIGHSADNP